MVSIAVCCLETFQDGMCVLPDLVLPAVVNSGSSRSLP